MISGMKSGATKYDTFTVEDVKVHAYGDTAVATGKGSIKGKENGKAIDQVHAEGVAHGRSFRHGNLFYNIKPDQSGANRIMLNGRGFDVEIVERHHRFKKDAPSGTALRIAGELKSGSGGKLDPPIASSRVGSEFGLHTLFFDSPDDVIEISHRARGREGFARGAVLAAELVRGKKGLMRFDELVMS